jgi:hypothetical protein
MHCPLCKAQYGAGYDLCRSCDADLVFTKEQADAEDVVLFLESANLTGVGELADALKEANVPNYSRFGDGKAKAPVIGLFAPKAAKEQSWQIFVLESDLDRARQVAFAARFAGRYPEPGDRRARLARFLPAKSLTTRAS